MSINSSTVRMVRNSTIRASVNTSSGQIQTTTPVTLMTAAASASNRLDALSDVEEIAPANGATLVYRSSDDKYVVQQLTFDNVSGNLDGGSF
jgi:hypothetical protein